MIYLKKLYTALWDVFLLCKTASQLELLCSLIFQCFHDSSNRSWAARHIFIGPDLWECTITHQCKCVQIWRMCKALFYSVKRFLGVLTTDSGDASMSDENTVRKYCLQLRTCNTTCCHQRAMVRLLWVFSWLNLLFKVSCAVNPSKKSCSILAMSENCRQEI